MDVKQIVRFGDNVREYADYHVAPVSEEKSPTVFEVEYRSRSADEFRDISESEIEDVPFRRVKSIVERRGFLRTGRAYNVELERRATRPEIPGTEYRTNVLTTR